MGDIKRLAGRNQIIQEMMSDGESLRNFYRFAVQNPHISLHDACQIVIEKPTAQICYSYEEWNAMGRKVTKGRKGIRYSDDDGLKQFVFDVNDTNGEMRYKREIYPLSKLLSGLDVLNGTEIKDSNRGDYNIILSGVGEYLKNNDLYTDDETKNQLLTEGIAYSMYCKTGFPKTNGIKIRGMPYSLHENADIFKEVYAETIKLTEELDEAILRKQNEVKVIDDIEEETISDEPIVDNGVKENQIVKIHSAIISRYKGFLVFSVYPDLENHPEREEIYLGRKENYDNKGNYDNGDNSLIYISNNGNMFNFLSITNYTLSQQEMVNRKIFSDEDYKELYEIQNEKLSELEQEGQLLFDVDDTLGKKGVSFRYPDYKDIVETKPKEKSNHPLYPIYDEYKKAEKEYPDCFVLTHVGDFYEIIGDKAIEASKQCDLTLTGRDFGLESRVPMVGFPYHIMDKYVEKLRDKRSVVIIEPDREPQRILSHNEILVEYAEELAEQEEIKEQERKRERPELIPLDDDDELSIALDNALKEQERAKEQTLEEPDENIEDYEEELEEYYENREEESEEDEEEKEREVKPQPQTKKGKPIKERKRKEKPQLSIFDMMTESEEESPLDKFKKEMLLRGSGFQDGKFRIVDKYNENPTIDEFAEFLKHEYGIGGGGNLEYDFWSDAKGFKGLKRDKEDEKNNIAFFLKWNEVAVEIADLIDNNEYITDEDKRYHERYSKNEEEEQLEETETIEEKQVEENTSLNEIDVDQNDLGGKKSKFRSNVEAIKLVKRLDFERRNPTDSEKAILAKYVGWGGIAEAFDERNENWQKECQELKSLLSPEDYDNAKGSVLNAHFTSKEVISGIYKVLSQFGVSGKKKILEPAMGTGNFFGYMPREIAENSKLYGVELDNITGKIAQKLYPNANIQIKGFEQTTFTNNTFDVIVGNVPFGAYSVYDSEYSKYKFFIHDYFIAKSIDKLKPNGLMAVITSKGTLDKVDPTVRKYLADRAELVGAIRLPNTAFKQNAGTEVVADILFFRKREEQINADTENTEWLGTTYNEEKGYSINNYYLKHPEMVLGEISCEVGMYGAKDLTVNPNGKTIEDVLEFLPKDIYVSNYEESEPKQEEIEVDYDVKQGCFKTVNGKVYMRIGEQMVEQPIPKIPKDAYERIDSMIDLRNELRHILDMQNNGCSDEALHREQWILNSQYDTFVKRYSYVNSSTNIKLFREDGDASLLSACEELSEDKHSAHKADIFTKRTIRPYVAVTHTDDSYEALQISRNEKGKVDIAYIEELTGKDYDTVIKELGQAVYRNPLEIVDGDKYSGFETAEEYLSGDVGQKLKTAENISRNRPELNLEKNILALKEVQPEPIKASDISVRLGTSWIDVDYYKQFLVQLLQLPVYCEDYVNVTYNPLDSSYRLDKAAYLNGFQRMNVSQVYGTERASAYRLFEDALNLKSTSIYDTVEEDGREKRVLNNAETIAAREKQNAIKEAFKDWIFSDPERREILEQVYNSIFNQTVLPKYDGSHLRFPGMNPEIELKPHQKAAVSRIITGDNVLLHHVVGSGKTYTIIASIEKLIEHGLSSKAMIVVPNHLVQQWGAEYRRLYPNAKILLATKEDLEKENRQRFVSRVALGDWHAVIIAQSSFAKIPISKERQVQKLQEELNKVQETIELSWDDGKPRGAIKNLERIKKNREAMLKKLMDDDKKDDVLIFENLGVDYLFVDEAHYYKNKFLFTKMNNVAGISTSASQRATDLELKCQYINEKHKGDKGVVFATGTPISNSMTEMFTMQSYLQAKTLQEKGIPFFDAWAADFGETVTSLELAPSGQGYKAKTRFAKFTNLPELLTMYRSFADVQTSDMVKLDVPDVDRKVINLKPSDTVLELADEIALRAEKINAGGVDPHEDNMLKVTSDGKKLALDPRCFEPLSKDEGESKINACSENIFEIWNDTKDFKGTQIVFCDLSTPKKTYEEYEYGKDFDVYNDLKHKLVEKGIPAEEIAFIHDANSDLQKQTLFDKVNSGTVRVLIGSTEKCGAGTNVQKRLIALHHLDTPYRPSDMEQREGRIIRQGNTNDVVKIFTYVTERTFDSYSYQILENKQRFISQINRGDLTIRVADDIDETTLSYAEIKAITAANPKIKRKMEVDTEVQRLRVLEGQYKKNLYTVQDKVRKYFPNEINRNQLLLERVREDIKTIKQNFNPEEFSISVYGKVYTDKKEGGQALIDALYGSKPETVVAEYAGFKLSMNPIAMLMGERSITITGEGSYTMNVGNSASGTLTRLENFFTEFSEREGRIETKISQLQNDLKVAEDEINKPFEHKDKLAELLKEQAELNAELDLNKKEEVIIDEEEENKEENMPDENFMAVPEKEEIKSSRHRKTIKDYMYDGYKQELKENPNSYIFVKNGDYYDYIGDKAEEIAEQFDKEVLTENHNGKELKIVSFDRDELAKPLNRLSDEGKDIRVVESMPDKIPIDFIDEEDKVAMMTIPIFPDYSVDNNYMHDYGYKWDGMLPLSKRTARTLNKLGLEIYRLDETDAEGVISNEEELEQHDGLFGIEKPEWKEFIESKEGIAYLYARFQMDRASLIMYDEDLSYVDEGYTINQIENMHQEKEELNTFLGERKIPFVTDCYPYLEPLMKEYVPYINSGNILENYGWDSNNVAYGIVDNLYPEELQEQGKNIADNWKIKEIVDFYLHENNIQDYEVGKMAEQQANTMQTLLEDLMKNSHFAVNVSEVNYDQWYKEFFEEKMKPVLTGIPYEFKEPEPLQNIDYREEVLKSVEDEFEKFRENEYSKDKKDIFFDNYKIHIYTELADTIPVEDVFDDVHYKAMYQEKGHILESMFDDFCSDEYASVNTGSDAVEFIKNYCERYHEDVFEKDKEEDKLEEIMKNIKENKEENKMAEEEKKKWITVRLSKSAVIGEYDKNFFMRMPNGEYEDYTYNIFLNRVKESRQLVDLESEGHELCYEIHLLADEQVILKTRDGDEIDFTAEEFKEIVDGTSDKDYVREKDKTFWYYAKVPKEAVSEPFEKATLVYMPNTSKELKGGSTYLPNSLIKEDKNSEDGTLRISLPEDGRYTIKFKDGKEDVTITGYELYKTINGAIPEDFKRESKISNTKKSTDKTTEWVNIVLDKDSRIAEFEEASLFKMPNSEFEGYCYYISNKFIKEDENGNLKIGLPVDYTVQLKNRELDEKVTYKAQDLFKVLENESDNSVDKTPKDEERKTKFSEVEKKLRENIPKEMRDKSNWVIVRTRPNEDSKRLDKFLIDCNTGKFAKSDDSSTWVDFETACKYANENGGVALAYALDGKDKICCIDLDNCYSDKGDLTMLASEVMSKSKDTYTEKSISGNGLHVFGKTDGLNVRVFSKNGDLEFYQKSHFMTMTGDSFGCSELKDIDSSDLKTLLENNCVERTPWNGIGKGAEGLSRMGDRDVLDKAMTSKHGDMFKRLYSGEDVFNNHSNSDMSLMNRLAFYCNADKEQMLRIFATSGLYREEKSPDYYEWTALKAIRDTSNRFQPKEEYTFKPQVKSNNSDFSK